MPAHAAKAYGVQPRGNAARLVAAKVDVPAEPADEAAGAQVRVESNTFAMYTRAADRVEVATNVASNLALGRTIDTRA